MRTSRSPRTWSLACLASASLFFACTDKHCCEVPLVTASVYVSWTIEGALAAMSCSSVGASTVDVHIGASTDFNPAPVPCSDGHVTFNAELFGPTEMSPSAGTLKLRLLDGAGHEVSALMMPLVWNEGSVSAAADFAVASPGGAVRYRWCQPLSTGGTLTVTANGPMWRESVARVSESELLISGLAQGRYVISAVQGGGQTGIGPADVSVDVTEGTEKLVTVNPCPLQ